MLDTYATFAPTGFDRSGAFLPERQHWFVVPLSRTRDCGPLDDSNFETALAMLEDVDPDGEHYEAHSFGHWACGWFEIILVDPQHPATVEAAEGIAAALEDYPVLDEHDYSERQYEALNEAWQWLSMRDRIQLCADAGLSIFAARREYAPADDSGHIESYLLQ